MALIGETENPQGVINTSEGRVVRAFHRFTLVDQSGRGNDVTKGRRRDQGAVKISCARQDPNARNCHGYRKFVKRSLLEDPNVRCLYFIAFCVDIYAGLFSIIRDQRIVIQMKLRTNIFRLLFTTFYREVL